MAGREGAAGTEKRCDQGLSPQPETSSTQSRSWAKGEESTGQERRGWTSVTGRGVLAQNDMRHVSSPEKGKEKLLDLSY